MSSLSRKSTINTSLNSPKSKTMSLVTLAKRLLSAFFIASILLQSVAPAVYAQEKGVATPSVDSGQISPSEVSKAPDTSKTVDTSSKETKPDAKPVSPSPKEENASDANRTSALSAQSNTGSVVPGISSQNSQQQNKPKGQTDQSSGAFTYSYPFNLTQGRNGLTPDVALSYNSQNSRDGIAGFGWGLSLPSIERINKRGVNKLFTQNDFSSSFSGELVQSGADYIAKIDNGQNLKYTFSNNIWTVTDKNGNSFVFSTKLESAGNTAKWHLSSQVDTNGNTITYSYTTDTTNNEITISSISYAMYRVDFSYEARPDQRTSYEYGFQTNLTKRLKTINLLNTSNSQTVATLTLNYATGVNGKRSLMSSITESRQGTTLPSTTFTYENIPVSFSTQSSWNVPYPATGAYVPADINGDGLLDISVSTHNRDGIGGNQTLDQQNIFGINTLARNNGNGTFSKISDIFPATWGSRTLQGDSYPLNFALAKETGVRLIDVNGDFMPDLIRSIKKMDMNQQISKVSLNNYLNGGTFSDFTNILSSPLSYIYGYNTCVDYVCETQSQANANILGDINGDGLVDMVNKDRITYNTGAKWDETSSVSLGTESPNFGPNDSYNTYFADINGDGLDDQISWSLNTAATNIATTIVPNWTKVRLNTGTEFIEAPNYQYDVPINTVNTNYDNGIRFKDINGDGLVDLIHAVKFTNWMREQNGYTTDQEFLNALSQSGVANGPYPTITNTKKAYLNTGSGWDMQNPIELPEYLVNYNEQWSFYRDYRDVAAKDFYFDVDGDGMTDYLNQKNTSKKPDVLKAINSSEGAVTSVAYKNTPTTGLNPQLPTPKYVVDTISTTITAIGGQGNGQTDTTSYSFENGKTYFVDSFDRGFAGFGKVTVTHGSKKTTSLYHQNDGNNPDTNETGDDYAHKGLAYQTDVTDLAGNLYARTYSQYTTSSPSVGSYRILQTQQINETFPGNTATRKGTATQTSYDANGNPTQITDFGEVNSAGPTFTDTGSDKSTTTIQYAISGSLTKPSQTSTTDQSGNLVSKTKYFYDSLPNGQINKGDKTKEFNYKDTTTYIVTKATYNSYGLPVTQTDANNNQAAIAYDTNSLYPTTVTDPKSHVTTYSFDTNIGKPSQITDANNNVSTFTYDGFGRPLEEKITDPETNTLVTKTQTSYTDTSNASSVETKEYLDANLFKQTFTYFDGALRPIQVKTSNDSQWSTVDTTYDAQGRIQKQSLPYFTSTSARTSAIGGQAGTTFTYDVMDRQVTQSTSVGTTTTNYNLWSQTVTDPKGNAKTLELDARGNLVKVTEAHSTSSGQAGGITSYVWNLNNNLIKQTDANGNIRNFIFDFLGRQTLSEDLHTPSDTIFGTRTATYDNNGNVLTFVNGENQTVTRTYDSLNRVLTETAPDQTFTFVYDTALKGKGLLASTSKTLNGQVGESKSFTYNSLGLPKTYTHTIDTEVFNYANSFDRLGNVSQTTYPEGTIAYYVRNNGGQINTFKVKRAGQTTQENVVTNISYTPISTISSFTNANGVITTNTHDIDQLYRLINKKSLNGSNVIQDSSYTYDTVGNILTKTETGGKTEIYTYDNLYRLNSAIATQNGSQLFSDTYVYDSIGNITSFNGVSYLYEQTGYTNPHAVTKIGTAVQSYDKSGNLTSADPIATPTPVPTPTPSATPTPTSTPTPTPTIIPTPSPTPTITPTPTPTPAPFAAWTNNQQITISESMVSGTTDLQNFTVLINLTDPTFKSISNGGNVGKTDGTDILFSIDGTTKLSHELESYNPSTGQIIAWVKIPSLKATQDTTVSIYYGNANATDQQDKINTWDTNTKTAIHFNEETNVLDSTNNANGTAVNFPANSLQSAKINKGLKFNGSQYVNLGRATALDNLKTNITVSAWINVPNTDRQIIFNANRLITNQGLLVQVADTNALACNLPNFCMETNGGVTPNTWVKFDSVFDGNTLSIYTNGILKGSYNIGSFNLQGNTDDSYYIGATNIPQTGAHVFYDTFKGVMDDLRISTTPRSQIWIQAEYNNQNAPGTYVSLGGSAQARSAGATTEMITTAITAKGGQGSGQEKSPTQQLRKITPPTPANPVTISPPKTKTSQIETQRFAADNPVTPNTYTWSAKGELISSTVNTSTGSVTTTYSYDESGQRIKKTEAGVTTYYPSKDFSKDSNGNITINLTLGDLNVGTIRNGVITYVHTDHLAGSNIETDQNGQVISETSYRSYGSTATGGQAQTNRGYIGEVTDPQSGLNYLNARYYNANSGRFVSQDPVFWSLPKEALANPQLQNSYSYSLNNPINYSDKDGRSPLSFVLPIAIGAGLTAGIEYYLTGNFSYSTLGKGAISSTPIGDANDLVGFTTGYDAIGNSQLSGADRALSLLGAIPFIPGTVTRQLDDVVGALIKVPEGSNIRFSQKTVSKAFDAKGKLNGAARSDIVKSLQDGAIDPKSLVVNYIEQDGYRVVENNRSVASLLEAGIPIEKWVLEPVSRRSESGKRIMNHLERNKLPPTGIDAVKKNN